MVLYAVTSDPKTAAGLTLAGCKVQITHELAQSLANIPSDVSMLIITEEISNEEIISLYRKKNPKQLVTIIPGELP